MSYYSVADILSEEERVVAQFNIRAIGLGFLDGGSQEPDLEEGARVELPYWAASAAASRQLVSIRLPKFYSPTFRTHLLADPSSYNLNDRCEFFYVLGLRLAQLSNNADIADMLQKALHARFVEITKRSAVWRSPDYSSFTAKLTHLERELFELKYRSSEDYSRWNARATTRLRSGRSAVAASSSNSLSRRASVSAALLAASASSSSAASRPRRKRKYF